MSKCFFLSLFATLFCTKFIVLLAQENIALVVVKDSFVSKNADIEKDLKTEQNVVKKLTPILLKDIQVHLSNYPEYFLAKCLHDTNIHVKSIIKESMQIISLNKGFGSNIVCLDEINKKPQATKKQLVYYILTLNIIAFLLLLLCQKHLIIRFKKARKVAYYFLNESQFNDAHIKIESHVLLLFYFLNLSLFLYLILKHYVFDVSIISATNYMALKLFCIVFLYNILKYCVLNLFNKIFHLPWSFIQYKINVIYKELLSFVYFVFNAFIILNNKIITKESIIFFLQIFIIIYVLKKSIFFFSILKIIKKKYFKYVSLLLATEYGIITLLIYLYFFL